jgi:DNA modification methylase
LDRRCWNSWKPIIIWRKPTEEPEDPEHEWFRDRISAGDVKTKDYHEWAQPIEHAEKLIAKFCPVGGLVVDPMCGSATIPLAALLNERRAVGVEEDKERYESAKERIKVAIADGLEVA